MHSTYQNIFSQKQNQYQQNRRLYNRLYLATREGIRRPKINFSEKNCFDKDRNKIEPFYKPPDRRVKTAKLSRNNIQNNYLSTEHYFKDYPIPSSIMTRKSKGLTFERKIQQPFYLPVGLENCNKNVEFDLNDKSSSENSSCLEKVIKPKDETSLISSDETNSDKESNMEKKNFQLSSVQDSVIRPRSNNKIFEDYKTRKLKVRNTFDPFEKKEVKKRKNLRKKSFLVMKNNFKNQLENPVSLDDKKSKISNFKQLRVTKKFEAKYKQTNTNIVSESNSDNNKKILKSEQKDFESKKSCAANQMYLKKYILRSSSSSEKYSTHEEESKHRKKKRVKRKKSRRNISTRNGILTSRLKVTDSTQAKETKALTPPLVDINKTLKQDNEALTNGYLKQLPVKIQNEEKINIQRFKSDNRKNVEVKSFYIENTLPKISTITASMLNNFPRYNSANFLCNFDSGNTTKTKSIVDKSSKKQTNTCKNKLSKTINYSYTKTKNNCLYNSNESQHKQNKEFGFKNLSETFKGLNKKDNKEKQEIINFKKEIRKDCLNKEQIYFCKELSDRIFIESFKSSRIKDKNNKSKSVRLLKNVNEC